VASSQDVRESAQLESARAWRDPTVSYNSPTLRRECCLQTETDGRQSMAQEHDLEREFNECIRTDQDALDFLQCAVVDGLWYWDIQRPEHEWMSPRFWEVLGYDPKTKRHLASEWQDLVHPDDLQVARDNFARHCANPSHPYDQVVRYRHADGSTVWMRRRGMAIRGPDGTPLRMLGGHTELTELKQREDELQRANAALEEARERVDEQTREFTAAHTKYRDLFDNAPDMLAIVDARDATLIESNRALTSKLGYARSDLVGRSVFDLYDPSCVDAAKRVFRAFVETEHVTNAELQMRSRDGSVLDVVLNASFVRDEKGRLLYRRSAWHDITARKQAEREAVRRNEELETLLHVLSHDLREPLRAIKTFSLLVRDRYAEQLDSKGNDFLGRVNRAAVRLDTLIEDVLELSRVTHQPFIRGEVAGEEIVDRALAQLEGAITESGARVRVEPRLPRLHVDRTLAVQAVSNLLSNALKFRLRDAVPELEIGGYAAKPDAADGAGLVVRDRGPGVSPEHRERIFEPFQRTVGREVQGTGVGLAIVRRVAEQHGGTAWVQSRRGGGSEFIVTFGDVEPVVEGAPDGEEVLRGAR